MIRLQAIKTAALLLLTVLSTAGAMADDYNPTNPPDPRLLFKVTVGVEPAEAGSYSGGGSYYEGQTVRVSTSASQNYTFKYWMQDGVRIDETRKSFNYVMGKEKTSFVAVYDYTPDSPQAPMTAYEYRLYVESDSEGSCTFNRTSGQKVEADQYVTVAAQNITPGYVFQGWYAADGQKVSSATSFNYLMPYENQTLTARFVYNPTSPGDPASGGNQSSVDNGKAGDLNGDGQVNVTDAVLLINHYLNNTTGELSLSVADVNHDGIVNVSDAVEIVNRYLNNQ